MLGVALRGFDDRGYRIRKETPAQPAPLILQGAMCCKKPAQWQASELEPDAFNPVVCRALPRSLVCMLDLDTFAPGTS